MQINGAYISHTDGNDVTVTSSSLMLFPGVWSVPLTIELTQDTTPESFELFNVTLTAKETGNKHCHCHLTGHRW